MKIIQPEAHIWPVNGNILKHIERVGRITYKSENAITEDSYISFIKNIIKRGHEAVLEHGNYIFSVGQDDFKNTLLEYNVFCFERAAKKGYGKRIRFTHASEKHIISANVRAWRDFIRIIQESGSKVPDWMQAVFFDNVAFFDLGLQQKECANIKQLQREDMTEFEQRIHWQETAHFICDRSISHELVRHRAMPPMQESQRWCNYSKGKFNNEITFIEPEYFAEESFERTLWLQGLSTSEEKYLVLISRGCKPEQARKVLPNSTKTEVALSGTIGEWMHFFDLRCASDADSEMRRLAIPLRKDFAVHLGYEV